MGGVVLGMAKVGKFPKLVFPNSGCTSASLGVFFPFFVILYVQDIELGFHYLGWDSLLLGNLHLYAAAPAQNTEHTCCIAHAAMTETTLLRFEIIVHYELWCFYYIY